MSIGVMVELTIEDIAHTIKKLKKEEKEELLLLLSGEHREIVKRHQDIRTKKVKPLSRKEVFGDVL